MGVLGPVSLCSASRLPPGWGCAVVLASWAALETASSSGPSSAGGQGLPWASSSWHWRVELSWACASVPPGGRWLGAGCVGREGSAATWWWGGDEKHGSCQCVKGFAWVRRTGTRPHQCLLGCPLLLLWPARAALGDVSVSMAVSSPQPLQSPVACPLCEQGKCALPERDAVSNRQRQNGGHQTGVHAGKQGLLDAVCGGSP